MSLFNQHPSAESQSLSSAAGKRWRTAIASAALAAIAALSVSGTAQATARFKPWSPKNLKVIGLTDDGYLVKFKAYTPRATRTIGRVSGFATGDSYLIGIDYRVQDGKLYGVGNGGGIYTIDTRNAVLTQVSQLSVTLDPNAQFFGVDFNPAANRLRIVSDTGVNNLSHNIDDGATAGTTTAQGALNDPPPAATGTIATGVTGAAYTNNDLPPNGANTATTLFDIDTVRDQVSIQSPPGAGTLQPTGKLGVDTDLAVGFDIFSRVKGGVTVANHAFASLRVDGDYSFYGISLLTGKAGRIGRFHDAVVDIAIPLQQ